MGPTLAQRSKAVGPTLAANVRPTDVLMLGQRRPTTACYLGICSLILIRQVLVVFILKQHINL